MTTATSRMRSEPGPPSAMLSLNGARSSLPSDTDDPNYARSLSATDYNRLLTTRNRGVVPESAQAAIRSAKVAVLGCGSIGGAAVEPLIRWGFTDLVLADPGTYELSNLNRQNAVLTDLGRNKALVAAERARAINPHACVQVEKRGVTAETVAELLVDVDVVIDGIDVTTRSGLVAKGVLHQQAAALGLPLMTGWDMSGSQYVQVYDYRRRLEPFAGRVSVSELADLPLWEVLHRFIPSRRVPMDMLDVIRSGLADPEFAFPQLVNAADLFGVLAPTLTVRLVQGLPVPRELLVDAHRVTTPRRYRLVNEFRRPLVAARLVRDIVRPKRNSAD